MYTGYTQSTVWLKQKLGGRERGVIFCKDWLDPLLEVLVGQI